MDFDLSSICYLVAAVAAIGLIVFGFWQIFKQQEANETDTQVLHRQIRGFAWLILAQVVFSMGASLCPLLSMNGRMNGKNVLRSTVQSARL